MTFGERLVQLRKANGYSTRNELAEYLGIPSTTLRNYETDVREPGHSFLIRISELFNVSVDYLLGISEDCERTSAYILKTSEIEHMEKYRRLDDMGRQHVDTVLDWEANRSTAAASLASQITELTGQVDSLRQQQSHSRRIAYYYGVSAGTGQVVFDDVYSESITIPNEPQYSRVAYAIKVSGHSMEPLYKDDSCLLIEPTCEIEPGEIGIFNIDGQAFVKKLGQTELISLNPDYHNIPLTEDSRCMGRVVGEYHID